MKTALVTGCNGAVGSLVIELLTQAKCNVIRFGRPQLSTLTAAISALAEAEHDPDVVFHFASVANVAESFRDPRGIFENNVSCTMNLLEALREMKLKPRIVLASTPEVYGTGPFPMTGIPERFPLAPANPYAASKAAQEALVHAWGQAYGCEYIITRAGSYVNPRRLDLALSAFAYQIAKAEAKGGDLLQLRHGNLDTVRPWCDARDIAMGYLYAAQKGAPYATYNMGAPVSWAKRLGDVLDMLVKRAQCPVELKRDERLIRPTDVMWQALDSTAFTASTGWKPTVSLDASLDWLMVEMRLRVARENRNPFEEAPWRTR